MNLLQRVTTLILTIVSAIQITYCSDTLVVACTAAPPFIIDKNDQLSGVNIWLWDQVAKDLNLTYKIEEMSFIEMLDGLEKGKIDVCINPLTMTSSRSQKFLFTSPFYVSNATVVMRNEGNWALPINVVKSIISKEFLSALIFLLLIVAFFGWLLWLFERNHNDNEFRSGINGVWDGFWWSAVTMTTVGYGDKNVKSFGGKVIALIWMFTALLFISGLTASIASTILNEIESERVMELDDLTNSVIGTLEGTSMVDYLKMRFFRNINEFENVSSGLEAVNKGSIKAFIYDKPIVQYSLSEMLVNDCEVKNIDFDQQLYAFGLAKSKTDLANVISERILYHTQLLEWDVLLAEYDLDID